MLNAASSIKRLHLHHLGVTRVHMALEHQQAQHGTWGSCDPDSPAVAAGVDLTDPRISAEYQTFENLEKLNTPLKCMPNVK